MGRNAFKNEEPDEDEGAVLEKPFETVMDEADLARIDEVATQALIDLRRRAEAGSTTAQHQLDLLMRDQEG